VILRLLALEEVVELHDELLARHGGREGLRDLGLLESAVAAPRNEVAYGSDDVFALAAAYAFHIAENQPFIDGNKRAAAAAALTFLQLNRATCELDADALESLMLDIAAKRTTKPEIAERLRKGSRIRE
jgi:death-on-curing protein